MKYALVIIETPEKPLSESVQILQNIANRAETPSGKCLEFERLNAGSYLFSLERGLKALATFVSLAQGYQAHTRTLFFDSDIPWVITTFN